MIMEYAPQGNLYNYIRKIKKLDELEAVKYMVQTAKAL